MSIRELAYPAPGATPPGWGAPLLVVAGLSVIGLVVAVVGVALDRRSIMGARAWCKPAKFGVSIALYCATLAWLLSWVQGHDGLVQAVAWSAGAGLLVELVLIDVQVLRRTTSHYNISTPVNSAILAVMGALVIVVFGATLVSAGLLVSQPGLPAWVWFGAAGGLLVTLLGMGEAALMIGNAGHTVGGPDGGPGLPLLGWSTRHGDLRVAHFVGMHALQLIPLVAWGLHALWPGAGGVALGTALSTLTVAYAVLVVLLTRQARRGHPVVGQDTVDRVARALAPRSRPRTLPR